MKSAPVGVLPPIARRLTHAGRHLPLCSPVFGLVICADRRLDDYFDLRDLTGAHKSRFHPLILASPAGDGKLIHGDEAE